MWSPNFRKVDAKLMGVRLCASAEAAAVGAHYVVTLTALVEVRKKSIPKTIIAAKTHSDKLLGARLCANAQPESLLGKKIIK